MTLSQNKDFLCVSEKKLSRLFPAEQLYYNTIRLTVFQKSYPDFFDKKYWFYQLSS